MSIYKGSQLISGSIPNSANQSLSNLDNSGQAVIDGKVSKSGDTMTGALNINVDTQNQLVLVNPYITKGTTPSERKYYGLYLNDSQNLSADNWKDTRLACIETSVQTNGTVTTSIQAVQNVANNTATAAGLNLNITSSGVASCDFPNTTCVDGQWVSEHYRCVSGLSTDTEKTYSLSSYLPNDNYKYEVIFHVSGRTTTAQGSYVNFYLRTDAFSENVLIAGTRAVTAAYMACGGNIILPVGTGRSVTLHVGTATSGENILIEAKGYRRIGTNN